MSTIDLQNEQLLGLAEIANLLPPGRRRRPVVASTILRWVIHGVKLASGEVVRLEAVRLGGRWLSSAEALARFAAAQTPTLGDARPTPRPPASRRRASERADRKLAAIGI
jgi:hypothetical protein